MKTEKNTLTTNIQEDAIALGSFLQNLENHQKQDLSFENFCKIAGHIDDIMVSFHRLEATYKW